MSRPCSSATLTVGRLRLLWAAWWGRSPEADDEGLDALDPFALRCRFPVSQAGDQEEPFDVNGHIHPPFWRE